MPKLIRKKSLSARVKDNLNPLDHLLWLSEKLETDWDLRPFANWIAAGLHFAFLVARANSGGSRGGDYDDVFGDIGSGSGWLGYISSSVVVLLIGLSLLNAVHTFNRRRSYRLFESNIDIPQNTPSAHRVRVDASPASSSPLQFFTSILGDTSAASRAHPDPSRDVWQIAMWDPTPVCLRLFCLFSPGHVLVYCLFLPTLPADPRPSSTLVTTLVLQVLLTAQLLMLQKSYSQQVKDAAIIQGQVMSEYDTKFVHPSLNPLTRDVGTQFSGPSKEHGFEEVDVDTYTPTVLLKRGFRTNPNPNYARHIDPENTTGITPRSRSPGPPFTVNSPLNMYTLGSKTTQPAIRQPQFRKTAGVASTSTNTGDGGSLGVYNHSNSPLKKAAGIQDIQGRSRGTPRNSYEMATRERELERERSASPVKQRPLGLGRAPFPEVEDGRRLDAANAYGLTGRPGNADSPYKRRPSRW